MDYDFTTDGCSGGISWAWRKITGKAPPWEGICGDHDKIYWAGGPAPLRREAFGQLNSAPADVFSTPRKEPVGSPPTAPTDVFANPRKDPLAPATKWRNS